MVYSISPQGQRPSIDWPATPPETVIGTAGASRPSWTGRLAGHHQQQKMWVRKRQAPSFRPFRFFYAVSLRCSCRCVPGAISFRHHPQMRCGGAVASWILIYLNALQAPRAISPMTTSTIRTIVPLPSTMPPPPLPCIRYCLSHSGFFGFLTSRTRIVGVSFCHHAESNWNTKSGTVAVRAPRTQGPNP